MALVCGIDFSPTSLRAAELAARMAAKWGVSLHLAHVLDVEEEPLFGKVREELTAAARTALEDEAARLQGLVKVAVQTHLVTGKPDEVLARLSTEVKAKLVVVAALSARRSAEFHLGGSADRVAQLATAPVLVVRDPEPLNAWVNGQRALKVLAPVDRSPRSADALRFVSELRALGDCDLTLLHLYYAADEYRRLGYGGIRSIITADPELERIIERELTDQFKPLAGPGPLKLQVELGVGRPQDRIASVAESSGAELVVVGSHRRNLLDRLWSGSTSRGVLQEAGCSVAVVTAAEHGDTRPIPPLRSVLVATDFSEIGNSAVRWAYALLARGGVVHLTHVAAPDAYEGPLVDRDIFEGPATSEALARKAANEERLKALEPQDARERGIVTQAVALSASKPGPAIVQAAERLGVDAVVLGTRGRGGVARMVLGSVAQEVGARCSRPVLLVHPRD